MLLEQVGTSKDGFYCYKAYFLGEHPTNPLTTQQYIFRAEYNQPAEKLE